MIYPYAWFSFISHLFKTTSFSSLTLVTHTVRGVKLLAVCTLNDVMSAGLTSRLTGQHADQRLLLRSSIFLLTCLTVTLPVARAEKYIGEYSDISNIYRSIN